MKTGIWIALVVIILGGAWWYFSMPPAEVVPAPTDTITTDINSQTSGAAATDTVATTSVGITTAPMTATVIYGAQGYTPASVTIAKGGTVSWVNQSGSSMWTASNAHPSHTGYAGTTRQQHCPDVAGAAFDECAPGNTYTFKFDNVGTWQYHNHMKASDQGTVIVQ